ncbi:MAG TPA: antitoxin family protein [Candidatus Wunengus sp. YC60]|uniref:antitoxin family protein n=1 Tax=Candidatus Wunengus sp. YC60 TaxID=3367697 RepID=UPI004028C2E2
MARTIKVRFSHGVIKPLEKVEFSEGEEFTVIIHETPKKPQRKNFRDALKATAGGWKDLLDAEELKRNIYADRLISTRPDVKL